MSWQGYIENQLLGTKSISQAAILGLKGGVWAASPGFTVRKLLLCELTRPIDDELLAHNFCLYSCLVKVSPQEQTALIKGFEDPSPLQSGGLHVAGRKYFCLQANDRSIYGKSGVSGVNCLIECYGSAPVTSDGLSLRLHLDD